MRLLNIDYLHLDKGEEKGGDALYHGHVLDWIAVPASAAWARCCCCGGHMNPNPDHGFSQEDKANCKYDRNGGIRVEPPVVLAREKGGNVVS